jgi:uncharacterized protein YkwD
VLLVANSRAKSGRTNLVVAASLVVASVTLSSSPVTNAKPLDAARASRGGYFSRTEACFMRKTNKARLRHGRRPLKWDKQLGYVARRHAHQIAQTRGLYHDQNMGREITRWRRLGQNTGRGRGCKRLFRSFMRSSAHRANILGRWRFMAVGTTKAAGKLYVQHVFEARANPGNIYHFP